MGNNIITKVLSLSALRNSRIINDSKVIKLRRYSACDVGDQGFIPGPERSHGEGNSNPPQDSCLENPMDRTALWATVH